MIKRIFVASVMLLIYFGPATVMAYYWDNSEILAIFWLCFGWSISVVVGTYLDEG